MKPTNFPQKKGIKSNIKRIKTKEFLKPSTFALFQQKVAAFSENPLRKLLVVFFCPKIPSTKKNPSLKRTSVIGPRQSRSKSSCGHSMFGPFFPTKLRNFWPTNRFCPIGFLIHRIDTSEVNGEVTRSH